MRPESESIAASTASTPASTAASTVARGEPGRVVRVEMDRRADLLAQRREEHARRGRLHHARHVLHRDDVRAGLLQLARQPDIIGEVVFRPRRIEDVAGVADRRLAELSRLAAPRPSRRACSRPSSGSRRRGRGRCRPPPPRARRSARHCRDSWCSRRRWRRAAASAAGCWARARGCAASRSHGSSVRKRMATSKVAPPQHSSDRSCGSAAA